MRKSETKEIGGCDVTCTQFEAMKSFPLCTKVMSIAAPVLVGFAAIGSKKNNDVSELVGPIAESLASLSDDMGLVYKVLRGTSVVRDSKMIELNSEDKCNAAFAGDLSMMVDVLRFALEVNFTDFFVGKLAEIKAGMAEDEPEKKDL